MKQRTLKSLGSVTLCMILALVSLTAGATMTATIDRNQMTEFEVLTLTVRVSGDGVDRPDFDPIERDFEIINTQTRQSSSFSFVNGRQTSTVYTDYILSLRARRLGELTIPALYLGAARTQPIRIQVVETSAGTSRQNRLVFFDTSVDTPETYVQGQIIYSVKLLYADSVSGGRWWKVTRNCSTPTRFRVTFHHRPPSRTPWLKRSNLRSGTKRRSTTAATTCWKNSTRSSRSVAAPSPFHVRRSSVRADEVVSSHPASG